MYILRDEKVMCHNRKMNVTAIEFLYINDKLHYCHGIIKVNINIVNNSLSNALTWLFQISIIIILHRELEVAIYLMILFFFYQEQPYFLDLRRYYVY